MAASRTIARASPRGAPTEPPTMASLVGEVRRNLIILVVIVAVMWAEEVIDVFMGGQLDAFGIRPREVPGLIGIPLAPFLHGSFEHLASNTVPFVVLGGLVLMRETWHFALVSLVTVLLGGLAVWALGPSHSVHIGASGVVFGYFGFLVFVGWFERRMGTILTSIVVILAYGSLVWGVLPSQPGVSWQSHLFGFLAGALCARLLAARVRRRPVGIRTAVR